MVTSLLVMKDGRRVVLTPEAAAKAMKKWQDLRIVMERDAGLEAGFGDALYVAQGVEVVGAKSAAKGKKAAPGGAGADQLADVVLKIAEPTGTETLPLKKGGVLVCLTGGKDGWAALAKKADNVLALEKLPRTSRAQAMDVLSSQANLGGYAAVLALAGKLPKLMPQMMTAAGSSKPANILVLGVGVAGLQAIATARRLGAMVWAFDVRPEVAEQIKSLGAKVVEMEGASAEGKGGYAGAMDAAGLKVLQEKLLPFIAAADGVVSTAQVPGRPAPVLISEAAVRAMRPGSVIVDMAAGGFNKANGVRGGNCPLSVADEIVMTANGVSVMGETNWPTTVAGDASRFWAGNMVNLLGILLTQDGKVSFEDELVKAMLVVKDGRVVT